MRPTRCRRPKEVVRVHRGYRAVALGLFIATISFGSGCAGLYAPSMITVPPEHRKNHPWGPEANIARKEGRLPYQVYTPEMAHWAEFGRLNLQDGDLLFRMGRSYTPYGWSTCRLIAHISDSPFSHNAIVCRDQDQVWVYDMEEEGTRKVPFEAWMLDGEDGTLAIKRLKPEYRGYIPQALAFCEDAYQRKVPFDYAFSMTDDTFYCAELVEKAFRSAGLPLSEPVPICCLPHYSRYSFLRRCAEFLTEIRVNNSVYAPGNDKYGIYACPYLELVYRGKGLCRGLKNRKGPRYPRRCANEAGKLCCPPCSSPGEVKTSEP